MEQAQARVTVFFEDPFWVCVLEREENGRLSACKLTLGGDPTDGQMYELLLSCWRGLVFSPAVAARMRTDGGNPKRRQRTAASARRILSKIAGCPRWTKLPLIRQTMTVSPPSRSRMRRNCLACPL